MQSLSSDEPEPTCAEAPVKVEIRRFEDLGVSPHQILIDLQKWESFGFVCTPEWSYKLRDQGMPALIARLWLWRELAVHFARKVIPWDKDTGVFSEPITVGSLWSRKDLLNGELITMRVVEVDPDFENGKGLVRAVSEPPLDALGGCKHSFKTFCSLYDLEDPGT